MSRGSTNPLRVALVVACAIAALFALAACGSDSDSDESAQELAYELTTDGKFSGPESADAGEADITFSNESGEEAEMQLIRVDGDHSAEDVVKGLESAQKGAPFPDWFFAGGGVASTPAGEARTVTQVLEPGTYYTTNTESNKLDPSTMIALTVEGDESDAELEADARVEAGEYAFTTDGLKAGANEIDFANIGAQPHHLLIAPLKGDTTAEEVEAAIKTEKGPPPFDEKALQGTAVIEGGESQIVEFELDKGRYVMLCFISDRQGGPPHALKGMVDEVEIK